MKKVAEMLNNVKKKISSFFFKIKEKVREVKKNIHQTLFKFEKKLKMVDTNITFKSYRKKYLFTDFEVLFFIFSFLAFGIYLVSLYWLYGLNLLIKYMFFLFLMPVFILVFFDFKAKIANRKKMRIITKRKIQKSDKLKNILLMEKNEDEGIVSNYIPFEKVEISKKEYIDVKYELKMLALEHKADAVIGIQVDGSAVNGYLAKLKQKA